MTGWAVTLQLPTAEPLEPRAAAIVEELSRRFPTACWTLDDLEAFGPRGAAIDVAPGTTLELSAAELLAVLTEDGQVIELGAILHDGATALVELDIRDGTYVDVHGRTEPLSAATLGPHQVVETGPEYWTGWP